MDESMVEPETLLTEALKHLPLAPLPPSFVSGVMAQIEPASEPVRFRLEFLDWAIPVFTAVFALVVIIFMRGLVLPGTPSLPFDLAHFLARFNTNWLALIIIILILEIYGGVMVGYWLWSDSSNFVIRNP